MKQKPPVSHRFDRSFAPAETSGRSDRPLLIAISGRYNQASDRILGEISGFDHYLAKPYEIEALLKLLAPLQTRP